MKTTESLLRLAYSYARGTHSAWGGAGHAEALATPRRCKLKGADCVGVRERARSTRSLASRHIPHADPVDKRGAIGFGE